MFLALAHIFFKNSLGFVLCLSVDKTISLSSISSVWT